MTNQENVEHTRDVEEVFIQGALHPHDELQGDSWELFGSLAGSLCSDDLGLCFSGRDLNAGDLFEFEGEVVRFQLELEVLERRLGMILKL